jgi:uncharacterized protein (DUF302 family)
MTFANPQESPMSYYFAKKIHLSFDNAVERVTEALKKEGFGVLTEIDVKATLKHKLDVDFRNYRILGACNPPFAYQALQAEDKIGLMLPCNVIVQQLADGSVEVAAIDPLVSMQAVKNSKLCDVAVQVQVKLRAPLPINHGVKDLSCLQKNPKSPSARSVNKPGHDRN